MLHRTCGWCSVTVKMQLLDTSGSAIAEPGEEGFFAAGRALVASRIPTEWFTKREHKHYVISALRCPHCGGITMLMYKGEIVFRYEYQPEFDPLVTEILYPRVHGMPVAQSDVPPQFAKDYDEACEVLPISPQCSAMLARRLLQALLVGPGGVGDQGPSDNLKKQIDRATQLPSDILEHLHVLREMGNFGAHQQLNVNTAVVIDVDRDDAEFALTLIHELFDHYFTRPARMAARKAQWNANKQTPSGRRPVK